VEVDNSVVPRLWTKTLRGSGKPHASLDSVRRASPQNSFRSAPSECVTRQ